MTHAPDISSITQILGGVCAPQGFSAAGVHAGIRKNRSKADLALLVSSAPAATAALYTQNVVKGAPLAVTKRHIEASNGYTRAVICNSGNANTCNPGGESMAEQTAQALAQTLHIPEESIIVASTGVIGEPLDPAPIITALPQLSAQLAATEQGSHAAANAILTTDTHPKEVAVEFSMPAADGNGEVPVRIGAMAKGSGMIHPNLATMLVFITSDAAISPELLHYALSTDVQSTFNMTSVDGDTSTNDMVTIQANGLAGNVPITSADTAEFALFAAALNSVTMHLCRMIAGDGEGATKLLECHVTGAADTATARALAKSVICSSLVKSAMFGADANWGRVLCALGYAGVPFDPSGVRVSFASAAGSVLVCDAGCSIPFSEEHAKEVLLAEEVTIQVHMGDADANARAWGCDLTYDYVKINGDYRT